MAAGPRTNEIVSINASVTSTLIKAIFEEDFSRYGNRFKAQIVIDKLGLITPNYRLPYEEITRYIFEHTEIGEKDESALWRQNINIISASIISCGGSGNDGIDYQSYSEKFTGKFKSHVSLSILQRDIANNRVSDLKQETSKLKQETSKIEQNIDSITARFVTILGIFTSITFALFGGAQLLGHVFGSLKSFNQQAIGSVIIIGSFYVLAVYIILVCLMTGLSKITYSNLNIRKYYPSTISIFFVLTFFCLSLWFGYSLLGKTWPSLRLLNYCFLVAISAVLSSIFVILFAYRKKILKKFRSLFSIKRMVSK
ncbi:hypothetical protein ACKP2L_05005 [Oenococcus alcoholitolerans]|uniref:hypothetical protein n=1 Tax=Oenococcus alcoholitolerans TaxID=931074 RepID=UPI003F712D73